MFWKGFFRRAGKYFVSEKPEIDTLEPSTESLRLFFERIEKRREA